MSESSVLVKPVYEAPRYLGQMFRGRLTPSDTGALLEGRVTTSWWGKAFFGLVLGLASIAWPLVLLATVVGAVRSAGSALLPLGVATIVLAGGWLIFWLHWRQALKEREKIVSFLRSALQAV